jgi:hypothetical protein
MDRAGLELVNESKGVVLYGPQFVNGRGAQESIPPAGNRIPGLLKRFRNSESELEFVKVQGPQESIPRNLFRQPICRIVLPTR